MAVGRRHFPAQWHITSRQHEVAERKRRYLPKWRENVFLWPRHEAEHRTEGRSAACGRCYMPLRSPHAETRRWGMLFFFRVNSFWTHLRKIDICSSVPCIYRTSTFLFNLHLLCFMFLISETDHDYHLVSYDATIFCDYYQPDFWNNEIFIVFSFYIISKWIISSIHF